LIPLTPEARDSTSGASICVQELPFRIGRDLRQRSSFRLFRKERRSSAEAGPNDIYLTEKSRPHRVSRRHILIDQEDQRFYVEDQRSTCGTLVEGETLGGKREGGRRWLNHGDVISIGGHHSPFVFKFMGPNGSEE
jgi:pSer/pThr/pTyr-binding forkhead associated (FHA) protein